MPAAQNPVVETLLATSLPADRTPAVSWKSGASAPRKAPASYAGFSPCGRICYPTFLLLTAILVLALPAAAKSWRVSNFQDTITVNPDGSALVNETITLNFDGEFHGIHRTIPIEYPGPNGTNYQLFVTVTSVTDENGAKLKYDSSTSGAYRDLKIYIPNAVDATRIVEIAYRVRNGTRFFDSKDTDTHDEFYWNVTGNDWQVPIDHAEASVHLPAGAAGSLRAQAFTGVYGSSERDATAKVDGANVEFETNHPLPMRGGLTIDVYIPKGILKEPGALTKFGWFVGGNPAVFLPLVTFAVMLVLWWYKGRDPDPGMSVAPMYGPPEGISPAEAGTLLDDRIHPRDITSTIVDLAGPRVSQDRRDRRQRPALPSQGLHLSSAEAHV